MFKGIRNYITQKKQLQALALDTLQKLNTAVTALSALTDAATSAVSDFNADNIRGFMENMNKIANDPELTTAYYMKVHEENK